MRTISVKAWLTAAVLLLSTVLNNCINDENALPVFENQGTIGSEGGIVKAADGAYIEIPAGALSSEQTVSIENKTLADVVVNEGCQIYDFTPDGLTFNDSVIICMPFDDEYLEFSLDNLNHGVSIAVFQDSAWVRLKTTVNLDQKKAYAKTNHFSKYVVTYPWKWSKYYHSNKNNPAKTLIVPHYQQGGSQWCAYFSLSMIAKYAGTNIKGTQFASLAGEKDYAGFLAKQSLINKLKIDGLLEDQGLTAEIAAPGWMEYDELFGYLMKMIDDGYPVLVNSYSIAHNFVVTGHNPDGFLINDPSGFVLQKINGKDYNINITKLSNIQISYKVLREVLDSWWKDNPTFLYGMAGLENTVVIKEPKNPPEKAVTMNFPPDMEGLFLIKDAGGNKIGGININGKYSPNGYCLLNEKTQNHTFDGTDFFWIRPCLSNSNSSDVAVTIRYLIDGKNVSGSPLQYNLIALNTYDDRVINKFQLSNLSAGNHLLSVELRSADSKDIYDFWDFPFAIDKEYIINETCNDFSGTTIPSNWLVTSGTWNVGSGELHGYWTWVSAQSDQGVILLNESLYETSNYTATTEVKVRTGSELCGERFVMKASAGNQININFNWKDKSVFAEYRSNSSSYRQIKNITGLTSFQSTVGSTNTYKVEKSGTLIKVFVNEVEAIQFEDSYFNGNTKLGLGAYGNAYYESFCIR